MKKNNKGFTLIELLATIAIISILAGVVLVSMATYAKKARATKAQSQLSSVVPNMVSCWGNGGKVTKPNSAGGNDICVDISNSSNYGKWPSFTGDMASYDFSSSTATEAKDICALPNICMSRSAWFFYVDSNSSNDDKRICCNRAVNGCASSIKASGTVCTETGWLD